LNQLQSIEQRAELFEQRLSYFGKFSIRPHNRPKPPAKGRGTIQGCSMGRKSIFHYVRRGKFAKVASLLHPGCHQGPKRTALNRYPEIFAAAAAAAPDARRILSFGCSSGEECVTLADYFPKAEIVGAEINPVILLKAMKHRSNRIRFVYASDRILRRQGEFDAVFCMAVLRSAGHYPFEIYEERALFLETLVRPGGLLVIHNSPYRFGDTARKDSYETIPVDAPRDIGSFLPDGVTEAAPDGSIFRKLEAPASRSGDEAGNTGNRANLCLA
jgi:Methyltransferase domain